MVKLFFFKYYFVTCESMSCVFEDGTFGPFICSKRMGKPKSWLRRGRWCTRRRMGQRMVRRLRKGWRRTGKQQRKGQRRKGRQRKGQQRKERQHMVRRRMVLPHMGMRPAGRQSILVYYGRWLRVELMMMWVVRQQRRSTQPRRGERMTPVIR